MRLWLRFLQWMFPLAAAVSAALCLAAGALWVRSYWTEDDVYHVMHPDPPAAFPFTLDVSGCASSRGEIGWSRFRLMIEGPRRTFWISMFQSAPGNEFR